MCLFALLAQNVDRDGINETYNEVSDIRFNMCAPCDLLRFF